MPIHANQPGLRLSTILPAFDQIRRISAAVESLEFGVMGFSIRYIILS